MLVKCPDCRREVSKDVHICPRCGCDFDSREDWEFTKVVRKDWSILGILSAVLFFPGIAFGSMMGAMIISFFNMSNMSENGIIACAIIPLLLPPIVQIILGTLSFKKENCYKWPGVLGIVLAVIWILLVGTMFLAVFV